MTNSSIVINWTDNSAQACASASDKLVVVAYNENLGLSEYRDLAVSRSACECTMALPEAWTGCITHVWIRMAPEDSLQCASDMYLGSVVLE